ncbi:hypothetical protein TcasGA2_TC034458 [Tribolium castaneum]|uniref:Uncharacterized protein n=1 Tax=Tribolium castaneum TaxID=7070 RepID=A0A139WBR0_TRICA|nr:hypothetical protein TcasGA2_TC034458 [Tribolium castaneum]
MSHDSDYVHKRNHLTNITPDQTVVIKKSLFRFLPGVKYEEDQKISPPPAGEWYPYVNSYYPFTEDVDAYARVSHLLESKRSMDSLDKELTYREMNEYSDRKIYRQFLRKKPVSFLVLGKPGMGEEEIGRRLAEYWKCVYIDPLTLLEEEIALETRAGQCIEFNLRCGRAVGIDILLRLLTKKVQTAAVLHRGFVCCGFPLVPNDLYEEDPISSESAIFNVREIFEELIDQTIRFTDFSNKVEVSMIASSKESSQQTEKESVEGPQSMDESGLKMSLEWSIENQICGPTDISTDLEKQLNCLFGVFHEPYLLIYIYGKNSDVITKRDNYFYDVYSKNTLDMQKINLFYEIGASNEFLTEDLFDGGRNPFAENPDLKHLVKVPENMPANVSTQLDQYHTIANQIDGRVLVHDIQYYLKLDGRSFISQMMNSIKLRLEVLPLQKAIIPERFVSTFQLVGEGVEIEETLTLEEAFLKFSKQNTIAPIFKWSWSDWGTLCPVSMFQGIYQNGSPKYAVHFLNKLYFLNNEDALVKFEENPRPYLLPPFPKPGSRVLVFGPPVSGKSAVSKCLGYLLNSRVLTASSLHKEFFDQMVNEQKERVKQMAIGEAMELLRAQKSDEREKRLEERKEKIQKWEEQVVELLSTLVQLWQKGGEESVEISSFPLPMSQALMHRRSMDEDKMIRESLISLNLPYIQDLDHCSKFLKNRSVLFEHLPKSLKAEVAEEIPSIFDSFVLDYVQSKVQTLDLDEIKQKVHDNVFEMYARGIKASEEQPDHDGWIVDGMTTDLSLLKQVLEEFSVDDIIVLDCSDYDYLLQRFKQFKKNQMHFRNFREFFLKIGEKDAAWRTPSVVSTLSYKKEIVEEVLSDIIRSGFDEEVVESEREVLTEDYKHDLELYQKEIADVKAFFDETQVHANYIDVKDLPIEDLLREAIDAVQGRYRRKATEFTDEDRAEEIQQMLANLVQGNEGEGGASQVDDFLARNRRYGDTYYYCPVTFTEKFVLWRGKEQFAAKFKDTIYLMANETNLKKFIKYPRRYLIQNGPSPRFPPPRICIVGCAAKDRTLVSKKLAKNLGVQYLSFKTIKKSALDALSSISLLINAEDREVPDALTLEFFDSIFQLAFFGNGLKYIGFVFDGFPQSANNLNYMVFRGAIPDAIICLTPNFESYSKQELESSLEEWRARQEKQRKEEEIINSIILQDWEEKRKVRYNELMDAKRQSRYSKKLQDEVLPRVDEEPEVGFTSDTQVSFDSVTEQQEHDETMKILDEEFPEPLLEQSQETEEEFIENTTRHIEEKYDNYLKFIEEVKSICNAELIPYHEINTSQDQGMDKVLRQAYIIGNELKFRGPSFFERCYDVSLDQANKLLNCGYYVLSTYGRLCPVESYKGENPLHCYIASQQKNELYPVIHRQYIYFVSGEKNRDKFFKNPLKYTTRKKNTEFALIPARVSIIGPPKSGKTSLSYRFQRDLGFRVVTLGESVRYVLSHPLFTNLRHDLEKVLRKGHALPYDLLAECVNAASFCGECVTQGLVFDGFPNSITGMTLLTRFGLVPHLIFDLQINKERVLELASNPCGKYPQYSQRFVRHLYNEWEKSQELFRIWCDREYQNIYKVAVDRSIWGVWEQAKIVTLSVMFERKHYYQHIKADWPLRLANMLVTPFEFLERRSGYKTFCPGCLFYFRKLTNGGDPPDRTGLVQYLSHFYWLCQEHIEDFLKNPDVFLPPSNVCLPQELPTVVQLSGPVKAVEDGYCVVCYQRNFPKKVLTRGSLDLAVQYRDKIFLFDEKPCLQEFMATPEALCCMTINFKEDIKVSLDYKDLPVLGMLEQFVARTLRSICIGLNMKIHNLATKHNEKYVKALEVFHERRTNLIKFLDLMKKYRNPAVFYTEPDTPSSTDADSDEVVDEIQPLTKVYSSARRVPVPDDRFDYLCDYFKPASKVPAFLNIVDIAGLVKGASEGQGLGNAFLSHISACDAIFHLCRAFEDDDVTHVEGEVNPVRDLDIIAEELRLKDEDTLLKNMEKLERTVLRGGDKKLKPEYDTLVKIQGVLCGEKKHIRFGDWDAKDIEVLNKYLFLTSKPTIYLVNLSEKDYIKKKNKWLIKIKEWVDKNDPGSLIIPFSGAFEHKLVEEYPEAAERKKYLEELNTTSALDKIIVQGYKALQLEYFFTAGPDEVKAWTIQKGTKAPQAAGRIHTDFEKGFIMAEVMKFSDFKEEGSEAACKAAGKYRQQGRNYVVEDGDIIFFKFNAGAGLKDAKKK